MENGHCLKRLFGNRRKDRVFAERALAYTYGSVRSIARLRSWRFSSCDICQNAELEIAARTLTCSGRRASNLSINKRSLWRTWIHWEDISRRSIWGMSVHTTQDGGNSTGRCRGFLFVLRNLGQGKRFRKGRRMGNRGYALRAIRDGAVNFDERNWHETPHTEICQNAWMTLLTTQKCW